MKFLTFTTVSFLLFSFFPVVSQLPVEIALQKAREREEFHKVDLFSETAVDLTTRPELQSIVKKGHLLSLKENAIDQLLEERPENILVELPRAGEEPLTFRLIPNKIFAEGFKVYAASNREKPLEVELGLHFKGVIEGQPGTSVAFSITPEEIFCFIGGPEGNFVLGKLKDDPDKTHIFYKETDLLVSIGGECQAESVADQVPSRPTNDVNAAVTDVNNCVNIYIEVDHDIFLEKGTFGAVVSYLVGFFNEVALIYSNDGFSIAISEALIWNIPSPYSGMNTADELNQFTAITGTNYNGDVAHLINYEFPGGIAYTDVLCNPLFAKAYSGVEPYFFQVPVYSNTVNVFGHELGHNCGSQHTHECVWNGNNTQIDDCGNLFQQQTGQNIEGLACYDSINPILPASGTYMSYCHLVSGIGIDFSQGFHPQVETLLMNRINNASCLGSCPPFVDTFYCYAHGIFVDNIWMANVVFDGVSNASGADNYSDFTDVVFSAQPDNSYSLSLTPGYAGGTFPIFFGVWIDFNQDKDFDDPGEQVVNSGQGINTFNTTINIPASALTGTTRMRAIVKFGAPPTSCENFTFGEVEDYTIDIGGGPCSPDVTDPVAVCQNISVCLQGNSITVPAADVDGGSTDACGNVNLSLDISSFSCADIGLNPVVLEVTDQIGNSDTCHAVVTVQDCTAPTPECRDVSVCLNASGNATISADTLDNGSSDNCGTPSFSASQTSFTCAEIGSNAVTLTVNDGNGNSSSCTAQVSVEDCTAPNAQCRDVSVCLNASGNATISADTLDNGSSDNCGTPSFSASQTIFTCAEIGSNTVTLTVNDGNGNSSSCTAQVTVEDCTAPNAQCRDVSVCLNASGNATISADTLDNGSSDNCGTPSFSASQTSFTCAEIGSNAVTLTVNDGNGNSSSCTAQVSVEDCTAPNAQCRDVSVCLNASGNATISADTLDNGSSDNCGTPSFSASQTIFTCAEIGSNAVTLTVNDGNGNSSSCTAQVTVEDCTAPNAQCRDVSVCLNASGNATISADSLDNGSSDNCGTPSFSASQTSFTCAEIGSNAVTLTVNDGNGNSSSCTAQVSVEDCTAPNAQCRDVSVCLNASGNATISADTLDNGSSDNCGTPSFSASQTIFTCAEIGSNAVTLTVNDGNGNSSSCTAQVTVEDCTAPNAQCRDVSVCLNASGNATISADTLDNGSSDNCGTPSFMASQTIFTCAEIGSNAVTLTVNDGNGNSSSCTAQVTVEDCTAPNAQCRDVSVCLNASGNATISADSLDNGSSDNCGTPSFSASQTSFTCAEIGSNAVTLTVNDGNGNSSSCTAQVSVEDCTAPNAQCRDVSVCLNASGNATISADTLDNGSSDNCGTPSFMASQTIFTCAEIGSNAVTLTVNDGNGNSSSCTAQVSVEDCTAPNAQCRDVSVCLNASGNATISADTLDNGSSDNCGTPSFMASQTIFTCAEIGSNAVTLTVNDGNGNSSSCTAQVSVEDCTAPNVQCRDVSVCLNASGDATISADTLDNGSSDNCGTPSFSASQTIFTCAEIGSNAVTLTVNDGNGNSSSCTAQVTVEDCTAPNAQCRDVSVCLNASGNATISADTLDNGSSDNCGTPSFSASQTIFTCAEIGSNTVTLTVNDGNGNSSSCTAQVSVEDCTAPNAQCRDVSVCLNASGNATISADTLDNGSSDNCGTPSFMASQTIFTCAEIGSNAVTLTVNDGNGNSSICTAQVTVEDCTAPSAQCKDLNICLDSTGLVSVLPEDVNNGSGDNCNIQSFVLSDTLFDQNDIGNNPVILTVIDSSGNIDTCNAIITVNDCIAPVAICQDVTVCLDSLGMINVEADLVNANQSPEIDTAFLSKSSFDCSEIGANVVTLTVLDDAGNSSTCSAIITVNDCTPPSLTCKDTIICLDTTGMASLSINDVLATVSDNCGVDSAFMSQSQFNCSHLGQNELKIMATDEEGNSGGCNAQVTVLDCTPPQAQCKDITTCLDTLGLVSIDANQIDNGSGDNCSGVSLSMIGGNFGCSNIGINPVWLVAMDPSGNTDTCLSMVTVEDCTAPQASCQDVSIHLDADGSASLGIDQIDNASSDNCGISTYVLNNTQFECSNLGVNTVILTVTDSTGLQDSCSSLVEVYDTILPVINCPSNIIVDLPPLACNTVVEYNVTASDNCTINFVEATPPSGSTFEIGTTQINVIAEDQSGNQTNCQFDVLVNEFAEPIGCLSDVFLSLESDCERIVTPLDVLNEDFGGCINDFQISLLVDGIPLDTNLLTGEHVGASITAIVSDDSTGDVCFASVDLENPTGINCDTSSVICPDTLEINDQPISSGEYPAKEVLISAGTVENGDSVTLGAGVTAILKPGFYADSLSFLIVRIDTSCQSPIALEEEEPIGEQWEENELDIQSTVVRGNSIKCYPNPFSESITIEYSFEEDPASVELLLANARGEIVRSMNGIRDKKVIIQSEGMAQGLYWVILRAGDVVVTEKILLIR